MKKVFSIITTLTFIAALTACNDIKPEDRYIELPPVEAQRVVLLEEFTGQNCVNCPDAHKVIESLLEQYPENLIAVSFHGGPLAINVNKRAYGLANDESEQYWEMAGKPDLPAAIVNRTGGTQTSDKWANAIRSIINKPSVIEMELTADYDAADKSIKIAAKISPNQNMDANLQLWVVEDSLVRRQTLPTGKTDPEYVHNNVFRAAVNTVTGETIRLITREPQTREYVVKMSDEWETPENLKIVAFVTGASGVEQAVKAPVKVNKNE